MRSSPLALANDNAFTAENANMGLVHRDIEASKIVRLNGLLFQPRRSYLLGSGSTLIAANETGRICRGVELDPLYVEVIIRRYELATRTGASLVETGETFELWRLGGSTRENEETVLSFPAIPNLMWLMRWCSPRSSGRDEVDPRGNGFFFTPGMMPWIKADCRSCSRSALPWRPGAIAKSIARFETLSFTRKRAPATAVCSFLKSFDVI